MSSRKKDVLSLSYKSLEERIIDFLIQTEEGTSALNIAKGVGLNCAKDVNPQLYSLEKKGHLQKTEGSPPKWSLKPREPTQEPQASSTPPESSDVDQSLVLSLLRTDRGQTALEIAKKLKANPKSVKKKLYDLLSRGVVEKSEDSRVSWKRSEKSSSTENSELLNCAEIDLEESSIGNSSAEASREIDSNLKSSDNQATTPRFQEDYDSIESLGTGAYGFVYKARRKLEDVFFAVKIVKCTRKALREVKALVGLHHENIVRYYTCWEENTRYEVPKCERNNSLSPEGEEDTEESSESPGSCSSGRYRYLYIQMELCEKGTLRSWIQEKNYGKTASSEQEMQRRRNDALSVFKQIINGVKHIHAKDLFHRDLKPENIFLGNDDKVKIGDFGFVTSARTDSDRTTDKGTSFYMSPEQVDIYALGLIYFELLWKVNTGHERLKICGDLIELNFPRGFSKQFNPEKQIIMAMLSKSPEGRPEASKIAEHLDAFIAE
ncbi:interferon-induced, double-stranded RNA-activated protein kinase isoform X2 [Amia ocellicauda]|uniref:interferon-induced, double-stranded RNA-activated protein kinase isoform X2 n=1 Tax=Amia ocellicauda TaxID=2972642 RepID=UPI003464BE27